VKEVEEVAKATALSLLENAKGGTPSDLALTLEKAAGILKLSVDLDKSQAEARKLDYENATAARRESSERLKEYVSLLTPVVTIVTLAVTLAFQGWQFIKAEKDKREAEEDAQWQGAVKTLSERSGLSPAVVALNPFLKSARYSEAARHAAIQLMANTTDPILFDGLFATALTPTSWNNLDDVMALMRTLTAEGNPLWQKQWNKDTRTSEPSRLSESERRIDVYLDYTMPKISAQVGSLLKTPRPSSVSLNLAAARFRESDWEDVNLNGANIENVAFVTIDLKDADLGGITHFGSPLVAYTAWWEAKRISPELLEYLERESPLDTALTHGPKAKRFSQQQYQHELARLKTASK
jgi:hypothetical protein